ncbi:BRO family protein [Nitratidesulfovibrio liaohensis]|uniref:Phage antirepressor KilAC domain-containing protein n=1 Tax=Nitratidesulfovibrio liaohensis TaxID=2604158 RepID=A0ABY9R2H8_9BACT|nr:BRO family protein [Nitratidesulfovibrio liaohensis]WMW65965.1 phage antirepressor KilAC domain-containing protein [Nitratidesulfovibrio liaohensis]
MTTTTSQNTPAIFSNPDLFSGNLRVIMKDDEPWFVAKDVCLALGFSVKSNGDVNTTHATRNLMPDEIITRRMSDGRGAASILISESGLYKLIMRSDKPAAKAFQDWVTREVLPSIRKTGGYIAATPDESPEVILARAVLVAQDTIERMKARAAALEAEVKELAPKAETYDAVVAQRMMKVHDFARRLHGVNSNRTKDDLRRLGYLHRQWGPYRVYAQYRDKFFVEKVNDQYGTVDIYVTDAGKQLMTRLYNEGKLTMRVGF